MCGQGVRGDPPQVRGPGDADPGLDAAAGGVDRGQAGELEAAQAILVDADNIGIFTSGDAPGPQGGVTVTGNNCRLNGIGIKGKGQGNRIEGNTLTENGTGIDLLVSTASYFAKNLLQANETAIVGDGDDTNGSSIDPALSNIVLP
jgi:parallel beta-helix repeat protein